MRQSTNLNVHNKKRKSWKPQAKAVPATQKQVAESREQAAVSKEVPDQKEANCWTN
jgi:hypothetical protein